jgi:predicted nucleotidyltransferase
VVSLDDVKIFAAWSERRPSVRKIYLFGSRIRGDNRPDSDLDIYIERHCNARRGQLDMLANDEATNFADLKKHFPFPLRIVVDHHPGQTAAYIAAGQPKLTMGKVVFVVTKPKP